MPIESRFVWTKKPVSRDATGLEHDRRTIPDGGRLQLDTSASEPRPDDSVFDAENPSYNF